MEEESGAVKTRSATSRSAWRETTATSGASAPERLGRFLKAALKVTLGFFVWLLRAVFKWVM